MGCARWTYEPEEAVLKSAPRMDWVERLLFFTAEYRQPIPRPPGTFAERSWMVVRIAAVSGTAENVENQCYGLVFRSELLFL
jgi:hypothetical protein